MAVHVVTLVVVYMVIETVVTMLVHVVVHMVVNIVVTMLVHEFELVVVQMVLTMKHIGQHMAVTLVVKLYTTGDVLRLGN